MSKINLNKFAQGAYSSFSSGEDEGESTNVSINKKIYETLKQKNDERIKRIESLESQVEKLEDQVEELKEKLKKHEPTLDSRFEEVRKSFKKNVPSDIINKYNQKYFESMPKDDRVEVANLLTSLFHSLEVEPSNLWSNIISNGGVL